LAAGSASELPLRVSFRVSIDADKGSEATGYSTFGTAGAATGAATCTGFFSVAALTSCALFSKVYFILLFNFSTVLYVGLASTFSAYFIIAPIGYGALAFVFGVVAGLTPPLPTYAIAYI
jgi:hypothetical protein